MPFPFVDRNRIVRRPALIVGRPIGRHSSLLWTMMITTARAGGWPGDVAIGVDHAQFGLQVPCVIRTAKIATVDIADIAGIIGHLSPPLMARVRAEIDHALTEPR